MPIPKEIMALRPTEFGAVEVQRRDTHFYVYLITSKWNREKGRSQKRTGKSIGKITLNDGFIPNANGMRLLQKMKEEKGAARDIIPHVRNYGAYELMRRLSPDLEAQLEEAFPDIYREIRTIALIRLIEGVSSAKMIRPEFLDSYLSELHSDLALSDATVRNFVDRLGRIQDRLDAFMCASILPGAKLLFDGTLIFTASQDSLAERGYNPMHSMKTQCRILYVFDRVTQKPVFYRIVQGSIVDKGAFIDTVKDSGCKDCLVIADKGFYSKKNISALMDANLKFILPLQDNTTLVGKDFYENPDDKKFDSVFTYNNRPIWYAKKQCGDQGNYIYIYRDDMRMGEQRGRFVERAQSNYDEGTSEPMDVVNEKRFGYFAFISNLDTTAKDLYLEYKRRWDIEQCFDYLKHSICTTASYAHTDEYLKGWGFINHISMLYYYGLINAIHNADDLKHITPEDVIKLTKNIYMVDSGDGFRVSAIQKGTQDILDALGVDLLRKN